MHVAIVGNGIAGITAALRLRERRPDWEIRVISGESTHPWSRPALMYVFMGHMRYRDTKPWEDRVWDARRIGLVRDWVTGVDLAAKRLVLHRGEPLAWDRLLIATGSKPNRFGWPGQELRGVQGLYGLPDLRELERSVQDTRRAVIVGGGLIGVELAEMLHTRGVAVTMLVRERSYWGNVLPREESEMVTRAIRAEGVEVRLETELARVLDDGTGRAGAVETKAGERIECQLVGLTAGVSPNLDCLEGSGIPTRRGVLVDRSLRARVPDVWAAGDCAEIAERDGEQGLVQQVWYTGRMQGEVAGDSLAGLEARYEPGIWFNSAKFFHLEYQVYGEVNRRLPGERSLYWEHADGARALRVVWLPEEGERVVGFNLMGVRERHRVCERWIRERRPVREVLARLEEAGFDAELGPRLEREAARAMQEQLA